MRVAVELLLSTGTVEVWAPVAAEDQAFTLAKASYVRFGVAGAYSEPKWLEAGVHLCSRATFGDPAYGVIKQCEVLTTGGVPPPPANHPPAWNMTDVIFEQGIPAEIDLRTRGSDADGDPLTFGVVAALRGDLVGPFSFNDFKLSYDGRDMGLAEDAPPLVLDTGITISAEDGR